MKNIDIDYINLNNSRYKIKLYTEAQGYPVGEDYLFSMKLGAEEKTVHIRHFGYVEVVGKSNSLEKTQEVNHEQ